MRLRERLTAQSDVAWDLVVIGAGITGAGVARDAAIRGLRVLVLEARDVAFGTSSRSSRLIHGGVRYLEKGEVGLVFEALRERGRLYRNAPHLVRRARFLFPTYRGDRLGPWRLRIGLTLYDALNLYRDPPHEFLGPEEARRLEPLLASDGLHGAVQYEDAITDDARLTLTVLQDAVRNDAEVLTYERVTGIQGTSGDLRVSTENGLEIASRQVVAAAGPWTGSDLLGAAGDGLLQLSKGIHIVMRADHVPVRQPVVVQAPHQRRILFVVPWGTRTYLGTTDAPYAGDPGASGVTEQDEAELLALVARLLPHAGLSPRNIVSAWSGVRPLVREGTGSDTVELSRRHRLVRSDSGVIGLVGGKLTTFRAMAEEAVDEVCRRMKASSDCATHDRALVPGAELTRAELDDPLVRDLAPRHGPTTRLLQTRAIARPDVRERIVDDLPYRWIEVEHAIAYEGAMHVDDILRRRLPLALTDPLLGGLVVERIAQMLVDAKGGTQRDLDAELERYRASVQLETRRVPIRTGRRSTPRSA